MELIFREATLSDVDEIAKVRKEGIDNGFWTYTTSDVYTDQMLSGLKEDFKQETRNIHFLAIDKNTSKIVAISSCYSLFGRMSHILVLGWNVRPGYESKGITSELVRFVINKAKEKGFKKVEAEIAVQNLPSIKIAEKHGLKLEGIKKGSMKLDSGEYIDMNFYGLLI